MKKHYEIPNKADEKLRKSGKKEKIITFNGQGRSGKTTQAEKLVKSDTHKYIYAMSHTLRDNFKKNFYEQLTRSDQQLQAEVLGIPSLAWLTADFHWRIKPLLLDGFTIVCDHYLGDYYADMLPNGTAEKFQCFVRENLRIPHFNHGIHFYLDIDYDTYKSRANRPEDEWLTINSKDLFEERRERYKELCELGYLTCIDGSQCESEVTKAVKKALKKKGLL